MGSDSPGKPPVRRSREQTAAARPGSKRGSSAPRDAPERPLDALATPTIGAKGDAGAARREGPFELGSVLATRYRILELLGEGGMGAVYRARDLTLGADVALKVLDPASSLSPERVDYFRNEVLLARRVTHSNVCRLHDIASEGDSWFISMEYVAGESLADRLRREPPLDIDDSTRIIREVASGLAAAHEAGVVHRDLKPDNILLADDGGRAVVADFGIAVEVNRLGDAPVDRAGTRGYMSPEQAAGGDIDARTDVFALGVLAHRMVTGELPWVAPTRVTNTDLGGPPPALTGDVPDPLARVIERCLQRNPDNRPAHAGAVLALLDAQSPRRPRRRGVLAAIAAALVLASAIGVPRLFATQAAPLMFRSPRIVVSTTAALPQPSAWLEDAFAQRLINELEDGWGVRGVVAGPTTARQADDVDIDLTLARSDRGELGASASIRVHAHRTSIDVAGETFAALARNVAAGIVGRTIPDKLRRPSATDLTIAGGRDAEAWRWFRRSQRASLRQEWARARTYSLRALELDPTFVAGNLEYAWTFDAFDDARLGPMKVAVANAATVDGLGDGWRRAIDFARADVAGDRKGSAEAMAEVLGSDLLERQRWYFTMRIFAAMWFNGPRSAAVPKLEWHVETFTRLGGAAKLLATHYTNLDGESASASALRYARIAVANAPDDVGARAELGRAEARAGNRDAALAQLAIIESADPDEKRYAVAGGEDTNSIFDLYIELGDTAGAARAARRLYNGNTQEQGHAAASLAKLALFRGDFVAGRQLLETAIEHFEKASISGFHENAQKRRAWTAFALGDYRVVVDTLTPLPEGRWTAHYHILRHISAHRLAGSPRPSPHLDRAEGALGAITEGSRYRAFLSLVVAVERRDWKRALALQDLATRGREYIAAYYWLGLAAEATGDFERAASFHETLAFHRFAWTEPLYSAEAHRAAARLRRKLGETERAMAHYETYLSRLDLAPPSHVGIRDAKRSLAVLQARRPRGPASP